MPIAVSDKSNVCGFMIAHIEFKVIPEIHVSTRYIGSKLPYYVTSLPYYVTRYFKVFASISM